MIGKGIFLPAPRFMSSTPCCDFHLQYGRRRRHLLSVFLLGREILTKRTPPVTATTENNTPASLVSIMGSAVGHWSSRSHPIKSKTPSIASSSGTLIAWRILGQKKSLYNMKFTTSVISPSKLRTSQEHSTDGPPKTEVCASSLSVASRLDHLMETNDRKGNKMSLDQMQEELHRILDQWLESMRSHTFDDGQAARHKVISPLEMYNVCTEKLPFTPHVSAFGFLIDGLVAEMKRKPKSNRSNGRQQQQQSLGEIGERILHTMLQHMNNSSAEEKEALSSVFQPSLLFHKVMRLHCQENNVLRAEQLLHHLEDLSRQHPGVFLATRDAYTIVLASYARQGKPREAEHILLSHMLERRRILPTRENFESCLNAWAVSGTRNSGQRAELLLLQMQELYEKRRLVEFQPTVKLVSKATAAWANSKHPEAMARAETVLATMYAIEAEDLDEAGVSTTLADTHVLVAKLWSLSKRKDAPDKCRKCLELLRNKVGFDHIPSQTVQKLYAALIFSWAGSNRRDVQYRVRSILVEMRNNDPSIGFIGTSPNLSRPLYHALFHAFAKTGDVDSASWLLKMMIQDYVQRESLPFDSPSQHDIPNRLPPVKPDVKSFNCVLLAWSRSKRPEASAECFKLLNFMDKLTNDLALRKDIVTYKTLLATLGGTDSIPLATKGHARLLELIELGLEPTQFTFVAAMNMWTKVKSVVAVKHMEEMLLMMKKYKVQPDNRICEACWRIVQESPLDNEATGKRIGALLNEIRMERKSKR